MTNETYNFCYDPQRQAVSSIFTVLSGSTSISVGQLILNTASILGLPDLMKGTIAFEVTIPVAPVAGQAKQLGLAQYSRGAFLGFQINGADFTIEANDGSGNTLSTPITWDTAWTATTTEFKIKWGVDGATFFINGVRVGSFSADKLAIVKRAMTPYIVNMNADDLGVTFVEFISFQNLL